MPTPVAHCLAGTIVQFLGRGPRLRRRWVSLLLLTMANFADLDFLPGYFIADPRAYHWGPTHSLIAAVVVGGAAGMLGGVLSGRYVSFIMMAIVAYDSHILLDMLLGASRFSVGLQIFWPFSTRRFMLPWSLFSMAPRTIEAGPLAALLNIDIIPVITRELLIMLPATAVAWAFARLRVDQYDQL